VGQKEKKKRAARVYKQESTDHPAGYAPERKKSNSSCVSMV
jgi:hypothetical protein